MIIEQTVKIPANRRVYFDIPVSFSYSKARITMDVEPAVNSVDDDAQILADIDEYYRTCNTAKTVEEALQRAEAQAADPECRKRRMALMGSGAKYPHAQTGLEQQLEARSEWPD
jgi:hypothetical protein